jgi:hypothetical protein
LNYYPAGSKYGDGAVRIFVTRPFRRFARKEGIEDAELRDAIERAEAGLVDAELGGGLIKQRVARVGQGRSGGFRTVIAYRKGKRSVFVHGFSKSDRENISVRELRELQDAAKVVLGLNDKEIKKAVREQRLFEVTQNG